MNRFFAALTRNPISLLGTAIATAGAVLILTLFLIESIGGHQGPYIGILTYLILPGIFVFGLLLIPIGMVRERRRARRAAERGEPEARFPVFDLNRGTTRRNVFIFVALTSINIVIVATATYKGVEVMDSTPFCGATCHTVMQPEYTAYQHSPHSRVKCVECHIGPGAGWFVKSKLSGAWQLIAVTFNTYPRPIPTPVHALRPARETCEQCHWPTKFVGDELSVRTHFADDEVNTELKTVLLLRVGGIQGRVSQGIHWHVDPEIQIRYRSDPSRMNIYDVELTRADGSVTTYHSPESGSEGDAETAEHNEWRVMDCVDCHNRPTHIYDTPQQAVDKAIVAGWISRDLPFVRREAVAALNSEYTSQEEARSGITAALTAFYDENHPELAAEQADAIRAAGAAVGEIYSRNVFPKMNVTWGTYPNHIGHEDYPGCFRCHNDEHTAENGEVISQDCDTCHSLLAYEEEDPEILAELNP